MRLPTALPIAFSATKYFLPQKFGHFVKTSPNEVLWTTLFALGINRLPCPFDLIRVPVECASWPTPND